MAIQDVWFANLKTLIEKEGGGRRGIRAVADLSGLSEEYVYQLATKKPNKKGVPREIGKEAAGKISKAFAQDKTENWFDTLVFSPEKNRDSLNNSALNNPLALINQAQTAINDVASLEQSLEGLAHYLAGLHEADKVEAMKMIAGLADNPDRHAKIAAGIKGMVGAPFVQFQKTGTHDR